MRYFLIISLVAFSFGCGGPRASDSATAPAKTAADRGEEIVAEYLKRDAAPFRKDRVRFTIREDGQKNEIFELDVWRREAGETTTTLSIIAKPPEDAGSASLTIEEKGKPAVNITYSVSRDDFRETDTSKMFFGGLTGQELLGEWQKYNYKYVGEAASGGAQGFELEGTLKEGENSLIASSKVIFGAENNLPIELHLFDSSGRELRTFNKAEIKMANGRPYVARTEVTNHVYNLQITIEILSRDFPEKLDDAMFTREMLKQSAKK